MKILLIYHFFHPDTVISAKIFSELADDLAQHGYEVTVYTGNRLIRNETPLSPQESWYQVSIRRFSRPGFSQCNAILRVINSLILQFKWLRAFWCKRKQYDAVILGTDPQFAYWMFPLMRLMNRKIRLIHWVFDLYPEAILASSPLWMKIPAYLSIPMAKLSYRCANDIIDIGKCMKARLAKYHFKAHTATLTPWALVERSEVTKADPQVREAMFGKAKLGLLYSGTIGYAHDIAPFIQLARQCRTNGIDAAFCFAGYGNCIREQTAQITANDTNIRIADFVSQEELQQRLASADIHLVSLKMKWDGIVVPSKFFASLAIGKPVLFSGSEKSCIAHWCEAFEVGQLLTPNTPAWLSVLIDEPATLLALQQRALDCYHQHFSRTRVCERWRELLEKL